MGGARGYHGISSSPRSEEYEKSFKNDKNDSKWLKIINNNNKLWQYKDKISLK